MLTPHPPTLGGILVTFVMGNGMFCNASFSCPMASEDDGTRMRKMRMSRSRSKGMEEAGGTEGGAGYCVYACTRVYACVCVLVVVSRTVVHLALELLRRGL